MKLPPESEIPSEKITAYLLVAREWDDKSKFLAQAGFMRDNPESLALALRKLAEEVDAVEDRSDEYGVFFRVEGELRGPNGRGLQVVTIWLHRHMDGVMRFVTLKPRKEKKS